MLSNSIIIKFIPLYAEISGTNESLVIPGWVLILKDKICFYKI